MLKNYVEEINAISVQYPLVLIYFRPAGVYIKLGFTSILLSLDPYENKILLVKKLVHLSGRRHGSLNRDSPLATVNFISTCFDFTLCLS